MKAKLKGRPAWNKGIPASDEAKEKNRAKHLGKRVEEKTRDKMSLAHKGLIHDGLFRKGNIPWNTGRNTCPRINRTKLRKYIKNRDKVCLICGTNNAKAIHHIRPYEVSKDNSPENLALLCGNCHASLHNSKRFGRPYRKDLLKD